MKRRLLSVTYLVCAALIGQLVAQVPTGTPPFGSFGGSPFDVVNLGSLNSHFSIPVIKKPGRGSTYSYNIAYDTSVWYPVGSSGSQTWTNVPQYGWALPLGSGTLTYQLISTFQQPCNPPNNMTPITLYVYGFFVYHDGGGSSHPFNVSYETYVAGCLSGNSNPSTGVATDNSGYTLTVGGAQGESLVSAKDGTIYNFIGANPPTTDANGNQVTTSTSGVITDTLGQTVLTITTHTTPTYYQTLSYTAPNGQPATYTVSYTTSQIKTNFGCSGIGEYSASNVPLITKITLPDQTYYSFTYETTPNNSGYTTARVTEVGLPTGGSIQYQYTGAHDGISCTDGSTLGLTRTLTPPTAGAEWQYSRTNISGKHWQTTVTSPPDPVNTNSASDVTVIDFQQDSNTTAPTYNLYETQRKTYQGAASGTPLETDTTCYNGNYANCVTASVSTPITQTDHYTQPGSGQIRLSEFIYSQYGNYTSDKEYDYGVTLGSAPSSSFLLRQSTVSYRIITNPLPPASLGNTVVELASAGVWDGKGNLLYSIAYTYDGTNPTATSGTPQHVTVPTGVARGNPTRIAIAVNSTTTLYKVLTYFDTGKVQTATDWGTTTAGGPNITTYNYANATATCGNAFPTSVSEPLSLSRSFTWDCTGGLQTSVTDENGNTSTVYYAQTSSYGSPDPDFWRPYATTDQLGNATTITYPNDTVTESALLFNNSNSVVDQRVKLDEFSRPILNQVREGPNSSNYDSTQTDYDIFGRAAERYLPFTNTADATCTGTCPGVVTTYDALNRPYTVTDGGGGNTTYTYTKNDVYQSVGPAPTGENKKNKQLEYDGLGRLSSVCEVTSVTGSGTCAQVSAQTGFWTSYTYDALGHTTGVTQNAQAASGSQQTRNYTFDMLGRMLTEKNPETGTITYTYDSADSSCSSYASPGDLVEKKDAMGNITCMKYDGLHRLTQSTYPSGSYASVTPTKCYVYDSATVNSQSMANAKGRLAEAYTTSATSCTGSVTVDEGFSYSARGEVSDVWEKTPDSGGYYHVNATYWAHGRLNVLNGGTTPLPGLPAITYGASGGTGLDGKGRITKVTAASGQNPATSVSWNAGDQVTGVTLGSSDSDAYQYDPSTGRMTQYKFNMGTGPTSQTGALTWNANGTLGSLQITDQINTANSQTCNYGHDDLTRIASVNCGSVWTQSFSLDPFGNLSKSGSAQFQPTYTGASGTSTSPTNQYYQISGGGTGVSTYYDGNGNLVYDVTHTYTWDADGNMLSTDGSTVTMMYDAFDRMIEQTRSSGHREIVYGPYQLKLALMNAQTLVNAFVKVPGGSRAVYNASGLAYYRHSDHLGNSRLATTPSRTKYYDVAYAPYGEDYNGSGTQDLAFTDENQDTVQGGSSAWSTNLYDFMLREYRTAHGRWTSPDPAGVSAVDPTNPQTWNRYAYVLNNPMAMIDLLGDDGCYVNGGLNDTTDSGSCFSMGGSWYDSASNTWYNQNGPLYTFQTQASSPGNPDPNPSASCVAGCSPNGNTGNNPQTGQSGQGGGGSGTNGPPPNPDKTKEKICGAAGAVLAHAGIALSPVTGGPTAVLSLTGEEIVMDLGVTIVTPEVAVGLAIVGAGAFFYCL